MTTILDPRWLSATVTGLASAIYNERVFERLPILADALMDAGCDSDEVMAICRSCKSERKRNELLLDILGDQAGVLWFSQSARQNGYGSDRWKSVTRMQREEREHVRAGGIVAFQSERLSGGNSGTFWRIAIEGFRGGFKPRVPDAELLARIESSTNEVENVSAI